MGLYASAERFVGQEILNTNHQIFSAAGGEGKELPIKLVTRSLTERFQACNMVMNFKVIKNKMPNETANTSKRKQKGNIHDIGTDATFLNGIPLTHETDP